MSDAATIRGGGDDAVAGEIALATDRAARLIAGSRGAWERAALEYMDAHARAGLPEIPRPSSVEGFRALLGV